MERAQELYNRVLDQGESAIDNFILTREPEHLFLDFKTSADFGQGNFLHPTDRKNLAKTISGFGNSEGGVIIWGVDCRNVQNSGDIPQSKFPINNAPRFVSWLEGAVSGCTVPPHSEVKSNPIITNQNNDGFVVTYIAKSVHSPHQVVVGSSYFYIRAGSSFVPAPYSVLAGMFGRRPQPQVFNEYIISPAKYKDDSLVIEVGFAIANKGPGVASDMFMTVAALSTPGPKCEAYFRIFDQSWKGQQMFGFKWSLYSPSDYRLPPESLTTPLSLELRLKPPFEEKLMIDGICGSVQTPSYKFKLENDASTIEGAYLELFQKHFNGQLTDKEGYNYTRLILGTSDNEASNQP